MSSGLIRSLRLDEGSNVRNGVDVGTRSGGGVPCVSVGLAPDLVAVSCSTQLLLSEKHRKKRTHFPHSVYFRVRTRDYFPGLLVCVPNLTIYAPDSLSCA